MRHSTTISVVFEQNTITASGLSSLGFSDSRFCETEENANYSTVIDVEVTISKMSTRCLDFESFILATY